MNDNFWSSSVQGILSLDLRGELRFRDDRKDLILRLLRLAPGTRVVDVGCGPGALVRKLAAWLGPASQIVGLDRDAAFVGYASQKARELKVNNARLVEGDALALPLRSESVDASISHTVIEHVQHRPFLLEQKRVCRRGGAVSVMWVVPEKSATCTPAEGPQVSRRESELREPIHGAWKEVDRAHGVGSYWPDPSGLARLFEELGFAEVQFDAIALPVVPDDARNSREQRRAIIEAERLEAMEQLDMANRLVPDSVSKEHTEELRRLIDERFSERQALASQGTALWDYRVSMVFVVSGLA
jgi:ubiquinone/menaquinone biosynthesis C-methylase UbiE